MHNVLELGEEILALPAAERERLATVAWESLFGPPGVAEDPQLDPEGLEVAAQRDVEIESGEVLPIDHAELLRRTARASA